MLREKQREWVWTRDAKRRPDPSCSVYRMSKVSCSFCLIELVYFVLADWFCGTMRDARLHPYFEPKKISKFRDCLIYLQQLSIFYIKIGNKEYCTHLGNKAAVEIVKDIFVQSGKNHLIWKWVFPCNGRVLYFLWWSKRSYIYLQGSICLLCFTHLVFVVAARVLLVFG